jgi:branched-subunit amino acid ABC-type transport system permease component
VSEFLQFLVAGLKNGSIYALIALGFTIVYAATGAINFAQGEFFMLGGMLCVSFTELGMPLPVAAVAAAAGLPPPRGARGAPPPHGRHRSGLRAARRASHRR